MVDWTKPLECKIWGWNHTGENFDHDWLPVIRFEKNTDGSYSVWDEPDTEKHWGNVQKDGIVLGYNCLGYNRQIGQVRNKKPDNIAVFYFERKGNTYTLTGWKNVMTADEIKEKYGLVVWRRYWNTSQCGFILSYWKNKVIFDTDKDLDSVKKSQQLTKEEYENLIKTLKQAGERLSKLVRDSQKPEKIEVKI